MIEMVDQIKQKILQNTDRGFNRFCVNKLNPEEINYITNNIHQDLKTACYILFQKYKFNYEQILYCKKCNKPLSFDQIKGKNTSCSVQCASSLQEVIDKRNKTSLEKYGFQNNFHAKRENNIKECLQKHGVKYYVQSEEFKEKSKITHIEKYGVENISHLGTNKYKNNGKWLKSSIDYNFIDQFCKYHKNSEIDQIKFQEFLQKSGMSVSHSYKYIKKYNIQIEKSESYLETKIHNFLNQKNIEFIIRDKSIIKPKELDIYIPNLNLAIEVNGDYWHQIDQNLHNKFKQINKTNLCESKGIRLIHLWGQEINESWNFVENLLNQYLENNIITFQKQFNNRLPRDYFSTLDFPGEIEEPILEQSYSFRVYKTGYINLK